MNPNWLTQLAPAHPPPPPGWWPLAPGWWGLALLFALAALIYWLLQRRQRLRRLVLRQLARLERLDDAAFAPALQDLLRRYAVARHGRERVAPLAGTAWIDFLVAHGATDLAGDRGAGLLRAAYGGEIAHEREHWLAGARGFIRWRK